jgi:uncharacterized protein (TIGR03067 family)
MRRATRISGLALAFAVLGGAGIAALADDAKIAGDLKKIQGTWVRDGDEGPDVRWVFTGDSLKARVNDQEYVCTVTLDSKATPHATADFKINEGPGESAGKVSKAIYKFEDDKLIICVTHPGAETRPTEFKAEEDGNFLFKLKKE